MLCSSLKWTDWGYMVEGRGEMTNEEWIELCLKRLSMGKTSDVMNFSYADTLAYIQRLKAENDELRERLKKFSITQSIQMD